MNKMLTEAPKLPEKIDDWQRKIKTDRTFNDLVEELHKRVWDESENYRRFLHAVWDAQAVEGSLAMDNSEAARILRNKAKEIGSEVADEKLHPIVQALNIVLRRYGASRKQRRNMIGGQVVPNEDNGE